VATLAQFHQEVEAGDLKIRVSVLLEEDFGTDVRGLQVPKLPESLSSDRPDPIRPIPIGQGG
jgi:hypothetical protein